jgi:hypothetical protein
VTTIAIVEPATAVSARLFGLERGVFVGESGVFFDD